MACQSSVAVLNTRTCPTPRLWNNPVVPHICKKKHVLVGSVILPLIPWKSRPNSFAEDLLYLPCRIGFAHVINSQYFIIVSVSAHITTMAASSANFGKRRPKSCLLSTCFAVKDADATRAATSSAYVSSVVERKRVRFAIGPMFSNMLLTLFRYWFTAACFTFDWVRSAITRLFMVSLAMRWSTN